MKEAATVGDRVDDRKGADPARDEVKPRRSLRADVEQVAALDATTMLAWERLASRAVEPNPFFSPAFVVPASRHLSSGSEVCIMFVRDGEELIFAAPIVDTRRWRRLRFRVVRTWCHDQCFLGAPIVVDDDRAELAWRLVLDALARRRHRPHLLILELMPTGGRLEAALRRAAAGRRVESYETYDRATLDGRSSDPKPVPRSGRRRRELERRSRRVEDTTGAPFDTHDAASSVDAVEGFLALEGASWTGRAGTALISDPATADFARDLARALRDRGELVLLTTTAGSGVAAQLFAIRDRDTLFMFKLAFDERLARFSPGTQLVHDLARWFAAEPTLVHIDSCAHPANEFINRLLPDRRPLATLLVSLDGGVGTVATALLPRLVALKRRIWRTAQ